MARRSYIRWALPFFVGLFIFSPLLQADIIVAFLETPGGVVINGSGSIETLDGLSFVTTTDLVAANQYFANGSSVQMRSASSEADLYFSDFGFDSFSTVGVLGHALDADPGVEFGITSTLPNRVFLPAGYTAGTVINFNIVNAGETLADFGFADGQNWGATWSTGNATTPTESILFSAAAVPEPSSVGLLCATLISLLRRRGRAASW